MGKWRIEFSLSAENDLAMLDKPVRRRVVDALEWLSENFDVVVPIPLGGPWKGFLKLRVGDWRVIYEIKPENSALVIRYIDHRREIYKRRN